jgi:hypothetical protein
VIAADEPAGDLPWKGRHVYDPLAIRPRHSDMPADITSQGSALAHPAHGPDWQIWVVHRV